MGTAFQFLTVFLKKCGSKQEDVDYRPLFENFLQVQFTYRFCVLFFVYVCQSSAYFYLRLPVLSLFLSRSASPQLVFF
jgi:hypothetical protein